MVRGTPYLIPSKVTPITAATIPHTPIFIKHKIMLQDYKGQA